MKAISKIKEALKLWEEGQDKFDKANRVLSSGPKSYYCEKIEEYVNALFGRFAPFHIDDRVEIIKCPKIGDGWSHCKHFLIVGAKGVVRGVDYSNGQFTADVIWDNETWISSIDGKENPVSDKHLFHMWENEIKVIETKHRSGAL